MTLVEITDTLPADRYHLGWTPAELADGTTLYRLHHPGTDPQHYSRSNVDHGGPISCGARPRPRYLYSKLDDGAQRGGSSGSVVVIDEAGGQVVGQLFRICGSNISDRCDYENNRTVDGALRQSFPNIHEFLDPGNAAPNEVAGLADFSLAAGQSVTRNFDCGGSSVAFAFTFEGTVSGISGNLSWASDLRLQLTGPSGSSYDVGGADNLANPWNFQGGGSNNDGTYTSSHSWVFLSGGDETTVCGGTWRAELTNDWSGGATMSWTDVSITLHRFAVPCPFSDDLVLTAQTISDTQVLQACQTITAGPDFTVGSTGDVTFTAGQRIILRDGFSITSGGKLTAGIDLGL